MQQNAGSHHAVMQYFSSQKSLGKDCAEVFSVGEDGSRARAMTVLHEMLQEILPSCRRLHLALRFGEPKRRGSSLLVLPTAGPRSQSPAEPKALLQEEIHRATALQLRIQIS